MIRPLARRILRPIPVVMLLATTLLVIKGTGLVMDARAQEHTAETATLAAAESAQEPSAKDDPAIDQGDNSSAQVDILASLAKRRAELDARERDLGMRENLIAAAEKRVDAKIASLKDLQSQIQTLLMQRDDAEQKQIAALVKAYSSMAPKDAARIFDNLNEEVLIAVASAMKPADLAPVLAKMQSETAQKLTLKLANRLKLPATEAAPQQLAQTPAMAAPAAALPQASLPQSPAAAPTPAAPGAAPPTASTPAASAPSASAPAGKAPAAGK